MVSIDITTVANALIALVAAIITTFVVPYIKSKTTENQRKTFVEWAKIAVKAAEQIYNGPGKGAEKKAYVISYLREKGFNVNEKSVEVAIEAAVNEISGSGFLTIGADDENEEDDVL